MACVGTLHGMLAEGWELGFVWMLAHFRGLGVLLFDSQGHDPASPKKTSAFLPSPQGHDSLWRLTARGG